MYIGLAVGISAVTLALIPAEIDPALRNQVAAAILLVVAFAAAFAIYDRRKPRPQPPAPPPAPEIDPPRPRKVRPYLPPHMRPGSSEEDTPNPLAEPQPPPPPYPAPYLDETARAQTPDDLGLSMPRPPAPPGVDEGAPEGGPVKDS